MSKQNFDHDMTRSVEAGRDDRRRQHGIDSHQLPHVNAVIMKLIGANDVVEIMLNIALQRKKGCTRWSQC